MHDVRRYLNGADLNSGFSVSPSHNSSEATCIEIWTANDLSERDPTSFTLFGSSEYGEGGPWTVITSQSISLPEGRNALAQTISTSGQFLTEVLFDNSAIYRSYKVIFPTLRNPAGACCMQLGEVRLRGCVVSLSGCTDQNQEGEAEQALEHHVHCGLCFSL